MTRYKEWGPREVATLKKLFRFGAKRVQERLPHRTMQAIHVKASKLGSKGPGNGSCTPAQPNLLAGDLLDRAIRMHNRKYSPTAIGRKLGFDPQTVQNAIFAELAKRDGTAAERDEWGCLTPAGRASIRAAIEDGLTGTEISRLLGISVSNISHERRRWSLERARAGLPPIIPALGGGKRYSGDKLTPDDEAAILEALPDVSPRKLAAATGISRSAIRRVQCSAIVGAPSTRATPATIKQMALSIERFARAFYQRPPRPVKQPMSFEEQMARVAAGAQLVRVVRHDIHRVDHVRGGVVGEIM